ncbi:MAG TPA: hypothetical protein VK939_13280, partial [Longimicrobiales bacterium]|nr:hypothetical protein [Longimicrobiales bacterium]
AVAAPIAVTARLVRVDVPLMIAASLLLLVLALDGRIGFVDGVVLLAGGAAYTSWLIAQRHLPTPEMLAAPSRPPVRWAGSVALALVGLALLVLGARWLVTGAVAVARLAGLSELAIGLTIVAAGTSLPELATSVLASVRGERDIAVGNIIGSNIFNILVVLGASGVVAGLDVPGPALRFDLPIMVVVAFAALPVFFTGARIGRREGLMFLLYYIAYVLYLLLASTRHDALPAFSAVMLWFALPLTFVTLGVLAWRWSRRSHGSQAGP